MTTSPSAYTLEVGSLFGSRKEREVTLLHHGRPCFSTTHSGIQSVLITRFPHLALTSTRASPIEVQGVTKNHKKTRKIRNASFLCTKTEEYLCIFHKDELQNNYAGALLHGSRSHTIVCTTYQASTSAHQQLPLPDFSPKRFSAGVFGVFIEGNYTKSVEQFPMTSFPYSIDADGRVYHAAADLWWMSSPVVVKPVYVLEDCVATTGLPSSTSSLSSSSFFSSGRTPNPAFTPRMHPPTLVNLNTAIIGQFVALGSEVWTVCFVGDALSLALVHHHYPLDVALWLPLPQRYPLPGCARHPNSLVATVPEHDELEEHIVFLYDGQDQSVRVFQTPNLSTRQGNLTLLFTITSPNGLNRAPSLLYCVDLLVPPPVLVPNYPSTNKMALFDVCTLLQVAERAILPPRGLEDDDLAQQFVTCSTEISCVEGTGSSHQSSRTAFMDHLTLKASMSSTNATMGAGAAATTTTTAAAAAAAASNRTRESWVVDGVEYDAGASVVFSLRAAQMNDADGLGGPVYARRRYEPPTPQKRSIVVKFPSFAAEHDPLLPFVLEIIRVTLGSRAVWQLEYHALKEAWRRMRNQKSTVILSTLLYETLTEFVQKSLYGEKHHSSKAHDQQQQQSGHGSGSASKREQAEKKNSSTALCGALKEVLRSGEALSSFLDPMALSAQSTDGLFKTCSTISEAERKQNELGDPSSSSACCTTSYVVPWSAKACGLLLIGLHLLYESCKLQESLWCVLDSFAQMNLKLSSSLRWKSYISFYESELATDANCSYRGNDSTDEAVTAIPSEAEVKHYGLENNYLFVDRTGCAGSGPQSAAAAEPAEEEEEDKESNGANRMSIQDEWPFDLFALLRQIVDNKGEKTGLQQRGCTTRSFPRNPCYWWTLRGLPDNHPISLAYKLYQLYLVAFAESCGTAVFFMRDWSHNEEPQDLPWWRRLTKTLAGKTGMLSLPFLHQRLSLGAAYPLLQALQIGKTDIGEDGSEEELAIVGRIDRLSSTQTDLKAFHNGRMVLGEDGHDVVRLAEERAIGKHYRRFTVEDNSDDGVNMPPDFPQTWMDTRLERAQTLMNTTSYIALTDADVRTADKTVIDALGWRACATTVARGMLTMNTHDFKSCDSIPIPKLNLNGMTETGIIIANKLEQQHNGYEDITLWPLFHNSCAAGLRFFPLPRFLSSDGDDDKHNTVSREKLIYQWRNVDPSSRAGLLLAAGVLGHFESLQLTDVYTILVSQEQNHDIREITAIAVLLGLSCSYRGTNNSTVFKCLSVHILSLTPSEEDVEIRLNVQTAAFVSIGLLCQGQFILSNAFLLEVFLVEMTRYPSDEHCMNREGYTLGAAFGLGLMLLGSGRSSSAASIIEALLKVMIGARREAATDSLPAYDYFAEKAFHSRVAEQTDSFIRKGLPSFAQCSRVHEGDYYNALVVGPGAVMALGLIFLKTEDELLAQKVSPPNALKDLSGVSPTMCLLRSLVTPLVMWSTVEPTKEWIYKQVPSCLNDLFIRKQRRGTFRQQRQYLLMNWGYCIAGTILALAFRYAGTMDPNARDAILAELKGFMNNCIGSTGVPMTAIQRATGAFEMCVSCCCIAASVVMAGTGDQELFSLYQRLYKRTNVSYGTYMSTSMSMGLLFLGGGRLTLSNSTSSIAALLIALYPVWPTDVKDNVKHLQALRHLYALAVVPRVVEAVEVLSQRVVSVPIRIKLRSGNACASYGEDDARRASGLLRSSATNMPPMNDGVYANPSSSVGGPAEHSLKRIKGSSSEVWMQTSCLYPPTDMIERIDVCSLHHYPISLSQSKGELPPNGIRLRLLEKSFDDGDNFTTALLSQQNKLHYKRPYNQVTGRLLDWIKRLCFQPDTGIVEARIILDNVKLMQSCQRALISEPTRPSQQLVSFDVARAVHITLETRYQPLFSRDLNSSSPLDHPLHMLLIQNKSFSYVLQQMCSSTVPLKGWSVTEEQRLRRWFAELFCYYNLTPLMRQVLQTELVNGKEDLMSSPQKRTLRLLRLHLKLSSVISYDTLKDITACCFGDV